MLRVLLLLLAASCMTDEGALPPDVTDLRCELARAPAPSDGADIRCTFVAPEDVALHAQFELRHDTGALYHLLDQDLAAPSFTLELASYPPPSYLELAVLFTDPSTGEGLSVETRIDVP